MVVPAVFLGMEAWILRTLGAVGTLLFASLFVFTIYRPAWVEEAGKDFITARIEEKLGAQIAEGARANGGALARAVREALRRNSTRIDELEAALRAKLHERIAIALEDIRRPDRECRTRVAALVEAGLEHALVSLETSNQHLTDIIQGRYLRMVGEITRDARIFTATNAIACMLLLVASFTRPRAIAHLVFPGVLLAVAVIVSSYCYVFAQDWFFTILYSDYFGYAYLGLLGGVFGFLADFFLNRGRITTRLGNVLLHAVGSSFSLSIC